MRRGYRRPAARLRVGLRRAEHLDDREEMWGIERVCHDAAVHARKPLRDQIYVQRRCRRGENDIGRGDAVELAKELLLEIEDLGMLSCT